MEQAIRNSTELSIHALSKPHLHALSYVLRHPDTWPEGFVWDYNDCLNCAMGLAHELWGLMKDTNVPPNAWLSQAARVFALPYGDAERLFIDEYSMTKSGIAGWLGARRTVRRDAITPEMVADAIDKYMDARQP